MQPVLILKLLVLLTAANGAPVIAKRLLGSRFAWPLDGGRRFLDGRPLLGASKTLRGVLVALIATGLAAFLTGLPLDIGFLVGASAMAGDLFSSFVKRRLKRPASSRALGLDQIPESLLPLISCRASLGLDWGDVLVGTALFLVGEILLSRWLYRLHIRDQPY